MTTFYWLRELSCCGPGAAGAGAAAAGAGAAAAGAGAVPERYHRDGSGGGGV